MLIPLPTELEEQLVELSECSGYVEDEQYTAEQREVMVKLKTLGLVAIGWVLTPAGQQRLNAMEKESG